MPIPRLANLREVGNTDDGTFSLEKVLSLRPDLVVIAEWSFSQLGEQVKQLEALDIPVMVIDPIDELRRYHEHFLPVTFEGTWMTRLTPRNA